MCVYVYMSACVCECVCACMSEDVVCVYVQMSVWGGE